MKKSFSYYLVILILKLKGVKKAFNQSPIDYQKLRKDDVRFPKTQFFKTGNVRRFSLMDSQITEIKNDGKGLILFIHGGAFVSGPSQHHWDSVEKISKSTKQSIWFCDYPKAPENKISRISENIEEIYRVAQQKFDSDQITLMGDSAGATLSILLTQHLIKKYKKLPSKLILISPVMDCSMENPLISELESKDVMLAKKGVVSAKLMCSDDGILKNPLLSPLFGSFEKFPETILFLSENDITFPDQQNFVEKLKAENVNHQVFIGEGMPHIWPLLPVMKESKIAMNQIIELLALTKPTADL